MVFKESSLIKHAFFFQITDAFVAEISPLKIYTGAHRTLFRLAPMQLFYRMQVYVTPIKNEAITMQLVRGLVLRNVRRRRAK